MKKMFHISVIRRNLKIYLSHTMRERMKNKSRNLLRKNVIWVFKGTEDMEKMNLLYAIM